MTVRGGRPQVNFAGAIALLHWGLPVSSTDPAQLDGIARRFRAGEFESAATATQALLETASRASREALTETAEALLFRPELQPLFASPERATGAVPYFRWLCTALECVLGPHHLTVAFAQTRLAGALSVGGSEEEVGAVLGEILVRARTSAAAELAAEAAAIRAAAAPPEPEARRTTLQHAAVPPPPQAFAPTAEPEPEPKPEPEPQAEPKATQAAAPAPQREAASAPAAEQVEQTPAKTEEICPHLAAALAHAVAHGGQVQAEVTTSDPDQRLWIYLDGVVLDANSLVARFALPACVRVHSEIGTGPRPAYGLVCTEHRDAVLGLHPTRGLAAYLVR